MIYLLGLTKTEKPTKTASELLSGGKKILLKSANLAQYITGGASFKALDYIYEKHTGIDTINQKLAEYVLSEGENGDCIYCVLDSPLDDCSCQIILSKQTAALVPYQTDGDFLHKQKFTVDDIERLIIKLRGEGGCPWDRAQTHKSIAANAIEEAYELADAVDKGDDSKILEETGDVLLQAIFHAVLAKERGAFDLQDAATALCQKLIYRHSHIFGGDTAAGEAAALGVWEKNKRIEKNHKTAGESMGDLPKNLPALMYAHKLQKRAAASGFDFSGFNQAKHKITEEFDELLEAVEKGDKENILEECGDLLFAVVNSARLLGVQSEEALSKTSAKFLQRFLKMEELIAKDGKDIQKLSEKELDRYYNAAKGH